jgi:hypothetical protein
MDLLVHIVNYIIVPLKINENFIVGQDWIFGHILRQKYTFATKLFFFGQKCILGHKCILGQKIFYRIESRKT